MKKLLGILLTVLSLVLLVGCGSKKTTSTISNVTLEDKTFIYDGEIHKLEVEGEIPLGVMITYENNEQKEVGVYEVTATLSGNNYETLTLKATLTITKKQVQGITLSDKTFTYDGKTHSLEIAGTLPKGVSVSYTNNEKTDAGVYEVTATFNDSTGNYEDLKPITATLTINKADYDLSNISFKDQTITYDGEAHSLKIEGNLPKGVSVTYENNTLTNVGSVKAKAIFTHNNPNYNEISSLEGTLTINKADYDLSNISFKNQTITYDGEEHSLEIEGNLPEGVIVTYENNTLTNVGSVKAKAIFTHNNPNYNEISSLTATLTITKEKLEEITLSDKTFTYDGKPHSLEIAGTLPKGVSVSYTNNEKTDAGVYEVTATFNDSTGNYEDLKPITATLTINKADYDLSNISFKDQTITYDGKAHSLKISGDLPEGVSVTYENNTLTNVGSVKAKAIFTHNNPNYNEISTLTATLTITSNSDYAKLTFIDGNKHYSFYVLKGKAFTDLPEITAKTGYTASWDADLTNISNDMTIYPKYTPITYKITYVLNGLTNNPANKTEYNIESADITLSALENDLGLSFAGWYTNSNFSSDSKIMVIKKGSTGDITLYARVFAYKIEEALGFEFDYVNYQLPAITKTVSNEITLLSLGKFIKVSENATWILSKDIEGIEVIPTKNVSLNAGHNLYYITVFNGDSYNLTYVVDIYRLGMYKYSYQVSGEEIKSGMLEENSEVPLIDFKPTKRGYTFLGWSLDGETLVEFPLTIKEELILTPLFKINKYNITYELNGGTALNKVEYTVSDTFTLTNPTKRGYTFLGWTGSNGEELSQEVMISNEVGDKNYIANWEVITYNITYELNGGTALNKVEYTVSDTFTLTNPTKRGYTFLGWTGSNGETPNKELTLTNEIGDKNYIANFKINTYKVNYHYNNEIIKTEEVTFNAQYSLYTHTLGSNIEIVKWIINDVIYDVNASFTYDFDYDVEVYAKTGSVSSLFTSYITKNNEVFITGYTGNEKSLSIPEYVQKNGVYYKVTGIGNSAFSNNENLVSVIIPEGVTSIGYSAFRACTNLASMVIPNSLTEISDDAFLYSSGLVSIFYRGNEEAFNKIIIGSNNSKFKAANVSYESLVKEINFLENGKFSYLVLDTNELILTKCTDGLIVDLDLTKEFKDYQIIAIGYKAFNGCAELTTVNLPEGVKIIGEKAFAYCDKLVNLSLKKGLKTIGSSAFLGCSSLLSVALPEGLEIINDSAFSNCKSLISVIIPKGVKKIQYASLPTQNLGYIFYGGTKEEWLKIINNQESYDTVNIEYESLAKEFNLVLNEKYKYLESDTGKIILLECKDKTITSFDFKKEFSNSEVIMLGTKAFADCKNLTSLTLPDSLINIGSYAFINCASLNSINIPLGVKEIKEDVFLNCASLQSIIIPEGVKKIEGNAFYGCESLKNIELPESLQVLGAGVFYNCLSLASIKMPQNLHGIGANCFYNCKSLGGITIPDKVTVIEDYTFCNCENLRGVLIPSGVTRIGKRAFYNNSKLKTVFFQGNDNDWYYLKREEGNDALTMNVRFATLVKELNYVDNGKYQYLVLDDKDVIINECIDKTIDSVDFKADFNGYNIIEICEGSFKDCINLRSVNLPKGIKKIEEYTFYGCTNLVSVTIPSGVTEIADYSFNHCDKLEIMVIPYGVNSIAGYTLDRYHSLKTIFYSGTEKQWGYIRGNTSLVTKDVTIIEYGSDVKELSYVDNEKYTGFIVNEKHLILNNWKDKTVTNLDLTEEIVDYEVIMIGSKAFYECLNLTSITLGEGIKIIEDYAFYGCAKLNNLILPKALTNIKKNAFYMCTSLESIKIPAGVKALGSGAFSGCENLRSVIIQNGLISIGDYAFYNCNNLVAISLPNTLKTIGGGVFEVYSSLANVFYSSTKEEFDLISNNDILKNFSITYESQVEEINFIENDKFKYLLVDNKKVIIVECKDLSIETVDLNKEFVGYEIIGISGGAFSGCNKLRSVEIPKTVTIIGYSAFSYCASLENISIPESVTNISHYAFRECKNLRHVEILGNLTSLKTGTFEECINLITIKIPSSVVEIGHGVFDNCTSLKSIIIPEGVTTIGSNAFNNCTNLRAVFYSGTRENWEKIVIEIYNDYLTESYIEYGSQVNGFSLVDNEKYQGIVTDNKKLILLEWKDKTITSLDLKNDFTGYEVLAIDSKVFENCLNLTTIFIPNSVKAMGNMVFSGCSNLIINCEAEYRPSGWKDDWNPLYLEVNWSYIQK